MKTRFNKKTGRTTFVFSKNTNINNKKRQFREPMTELKFLDTSLITSTLDVNTAGEDGEHNPSATIGLTTMAQGDGGSNRDGRRATWYSINIQGTINVPSQTGRTTADNAFSYFIALVLDKQTNGAFASSESVYINPGGAQITGTTPLRNLAQSNRFRVIATRSGTIQAPNMAFDGTNIEAGGMKRTFKIFHTFRKPITANYTGTDNTIARSTDNSLILLAWANDVDLVPSISYNSRLRFRG